MYNYISLFCYELCDIKLLWRGFVFAELRFEMFLSWFLLFMVDFYL